MSTPPTSTATAELPQDRKTYAAFTVGDVVYQIPGMKWKQIRPVWLIMRDMGLLVNDPNDPNFIDAQLKRTEMCIQIFAIAAKRSEYPEVQKLTVEFIEENLSFDENLKMFGTLNELLDVSGFVQTGEVQPLKEVTIPSAA